MKTCTGKRSCSHQSNNEWQTRFIIKVYIKGCFVRARIWCPVILSLGTLTFHIWVSGFESWILCFLTSFLVICILRRQDDADSSTYDWHRKPGLDFWFLALPGSNLVVIGIWGVKQPMESLSCKLKKENKKNKNCKIQKSPFVNPRP